VSRYQKGKTNLDFTEARDSEWQWHQQVCISHQTDNHASTPLLSFYGPDAFLPPNQQRQSTECIPTAVPEQLLTQAILGECCIQKFFKNYLRNPFATMFQTVLPLVNFLEGAEYFDY